MWASYPGDYRGAEIRRILGAVRAGECIEIVGLSGSGKSNLLGFLANRVEVSEGRPRFVLVDCNRLEAIQPSALFQQIDEALQQAGMAKPAESAHSLSELQSVIESALDGCDGLCLLFDRFELILQAEGVFFGNLRALRDAFKYRLTYGIATRHPLAADNELAELFFGKRLWLGALSAADGLWSLQRYGERLGRRWSGAEEKVLLELSGGYPALLRAACEAYADGAPLEAEALRRHPAVRRRVDELLSDLPGQEDLERSGLSGNQLLGPPSIWESSSRGIDTSRLTAKENLLLEYLQAHAGQVCDKDHLIQAVWPEDHIFEVGVRDESLAQLVRRLRKKIELDPDHPQLIQTISNRGYLFQPG